MRVGIHGFVMVFRILGAFRDSKRPPDVTVVETPIEFTRRRTIVTRKSYVTSHHEPPVIVTSGDKW